MDQPKERQKAANRQLLMLTAIPFLVLLLYIVIPAFHVGFTSDDFVHLVEDVNRPWYFSSDHLNRPLRNALFRLLPAVFGLNPTPYRALAFAFYAVTALLLFRFLTVMGIHRFSALSATALFLFFPRNHEFLFWFAAFQDLVAVSCVLVACIAWISYLRNARPLPFVAALLAYALALGFKETAIGLPVVLFTLELLTTYTPAPARLLGRLRRYSLFLAVAVVFAGYVFLAGSGNSTHATGVSIYKLTSLLGVVPPLLRTLVNIVLPFSPALALRDLKPFHILMLALASATLLFAAKISTRRRLWLFSLCWFVVFALPVATFARAVNADRYLMLPGIAVLLLFASALDRIDPFGWRVAILVWTCLLVYAFAGTKGLVHSREEYRAAAEEIDHLTSEAVQLLRSETVGPDSQIVFVNVTHSRNVGVLNNGLRGALIAKGLSRGAAIVYNFSELDHNQGLVQSLKSCTADRTGATRQVVLLYSAGHLIDVTGKCASKSYEADRNHRPNAWFDALASHD